MRMIARFILAGLAGLLAPAAVNAQGLYPNGIDFSSSGSAASIGFQNPVDPPHPGGVSFNATPDGNFVLLGNFLITTGDPYAFFLTSAGADFSPPNITPDKAVISNIYLSPSFAVSSSQPFYLGLWLPGTSYSQTQGFTPADGDAYGWIELDYQNGELVDLGSALSNPSSGIIVGTDTVLPEPSSLLLFLVSAPFLLLFLNRASARGAW